MQLVLKKKKNTFSLENKCLSHDKVGRLKHPRYRKRAHRRTILSKIWIVVESVLKLKPPGFRVTIRVSKNADRDCLVHFFQLIFVLLMAFSRPLYNATFIGHVRRLFYTRTCLFFFYYRGKPSVYYIYDVDRLEKEKKGCFIIRCSLYRIVHGHFDRCKHPEIYGPVSLYGFLYYTVAVVPTRVHKCIITTHDDRLGFTSRPSHPRRRPSRTTLLPRDFS